MGDQVDDLIREGLEAPFSGWDFGWLRGRTSVEPLPWRYPAEVEVRARASARMLDMGTGGGEVLAGLAARGQITVATEAWPPNVPIAAARLRPLGVMVVQDEGAPDNDDQDADNVRGRLPFRTAVFDLVANRHEAFRAAEVARVLRPGGTFITQQVDFHTYDDFFSALELPVPVQPSSWLPLAESQVTAARLQVDRALNGVERQQFRDVAAVVHYLRAVPWALPDFDPHRCRPALHRLHAELQRGPLTVRQRRFLLIAHKPLAHEAA